jgi:hypothetical protein
LTAAFVNPEVAFDAMRIEALERLLRVIFS